MNPNIAQLYAIAQKPSRFIIGLMSGTSLDGLDIALCEFTGSGKSTTVTLKEFATVAYTPDFKSEIQKVFSKETIELRQLCLLNGWLGNAHGKMILDCLEKWNVAPQNVDLIASHGQTIYHAPRRLHLQEGFKNATLQIGDGDHIAVTTGIITFSDFRQKNIAGGGEGAPLALFGDRLLFSKKDEDRILLNMGGIANFTLLFGDGSEPVCSDIGPGNTLLDAVVRHYKPGYFFDKDAGWAKQGFVNEALLAKLMAHPFFSQDLPKTTGPEMFGWDYLAGCLAATQNDNISAEDLLATLVMLSASTISSCIKIATKKNPLTLYASGGGWHNPLLMEQIRALLPGYTFASTAELGIDGDAKEAVLFAILANESVAATEQLYSDAVNNLSLGKISFPN